MPSEHTQPNRKQLLSQLTLAGAATLAAASAADADIHYTSVEQDVKPYSSFLAPYSLPGNALLRVTTFTEPAYPQSGIHGDKMVTAGENLYGYKNLVLFKQALVGKGKTFNQVAGNTGAVFQLASVQTFGGTHGTAKYSDQYLPFKFVNTNNSQTDYGWLEVSLTDNSFANFTEHIVGYAYDDSGTHITIGDRGTMTSAVPESATGASLAIFGALTLGAVGVRRLKALKN